jgi:peptide/nickel transport system permease protein
VLKLIGQRLLQMALIMIAVSLILFIVFDSPKFKKQLAVSDLGGLAVATLTPSDYEQWLEKKGLNVPIYER